MQVVQTNQDLLGHSSHNWKRDSLVIVALHDFQKIDSENFKHHDEMLAIGTRVEEGIQKLNSVAVLNLVATSFMEGFVISLVLYHTLDPLLIESISGNHVKDLHFIIGSLLVM